MIRGLLWPSHLIFNPKVASFGSCCKTSTADHRNVQTAQRNFKIARVVPSANRLSLADHRNVRTTWAMGAKM